MKKIRFLLPVCPLAAVMLELLPYGVVLRFGQPDGEPIRQTFSYFSLMPYGYATFSPLITAVMSSVLLILALAALLHPCVKLLRANGNVSAVAAMLSIAPWVVRGFPYFTAIGGLITLMLALHTVLIMVLLKKTEVTADGTSQNF